MVLEQRSLPTALDASRQADACAGLRGRRKPEPSQADWLEAALLLKDAAGVRAAPDAAHGFDGLAAWGAAGLALAGNASAEAARRGDRTLSAADGGGSMERLAGAGGDPLEWGYAGAEVAPDGHAGALVELARATERGAFICTLACGCGKQEAWALLLHGSGVHAGAQTEGSLRMGISLRRVMPTALQCAGEGVPANALLAWWLLREASARGHAGAQTEVGLRLATGALPAPDGSDALALRPPRWREAAVYLYFGAAGNNTLAQVCAFVQRFSWARERKFMCWPPCGFTCTRHCSSLERR